jgi:hypothetical protein
LISGQFRISVGAISNMLVQFQHGCGAISNNFKHVVGSNFSIKEVACLKEVACFASKFKVSQAARKLLNNCSQKKSQHQGSDGNDEIRREGK